MTFKKMPLRTCIGCGQKKPRNELISIIKSPKSESTPSFEIFEQNVKKDGRSAYICRNTECFKRALKYKKVEKSFKCKIGKQVYDAIENIIDKSNENTPHENKTNQRISDFKTVAVSEKLRNFLGITKKSGNIILGMDCVKEGIVKKEVGLILTTNDISDNSLEEIKSFALSNKIKLFKISFSKDDISDLFGKYSAIIGIKNENFINKIMEIINSSFDDTELQNKKPNREECNI